MEYGFLDALFDSVFVLDEDRAIVYCNEAAATLCESSVRRLTKGKVISDVLSFAHADIYLMPGGTVGKSEVFPMTEMGFKVLASGREGKAQMTVHPFKDPSGSSRWVCVLRDVSLEEILQGKYHAQLEQKQVVIDQLQQAQVQLEAYSKNLEHMVEERTLEVKRANAMLNAIMNSLGQGFLVFDVHGVCGSAYTRACEEVLEIIPVGQKIWNVLKLEPQETETFQMWMSAVFGKKLPFESLKDLAPSGFRHSKSRNVRLDYFPIHGEGVDRPISHIVVVATDWTAEFEANKALEKEKNFAQMIVKLVTSKTQFKKFLQNLEQELKAVQTSAQDDQGMFDAEWAFRVLHTIEGEAGTFGLEPLRLASREPQQVLEPLRTGKSPFLSVRSDFLKALDDFKLVQDQLIRENRDLFEAVGVIGEDKIEVRASKVQGALQHLKKVNCAPELIQFFHQLFYEQPVHRLFAHYEDMAQSLSQKLNKKIKPFHWSGTDKEVPVARFERLAATFVHVFRNIIDHGIEPSEDRVMLGKNEQGTVKFVYSEFERNGVLWSRFTVQDDGQGIHPEVIRKKLSSLGRDPNINLSDFDLLQVVFESGFSTRTEVGEYSGRGIGMNAVREEAERLGVRAWVESQVGQGTSLFVEVPRHDKDQSLRLSA